MPGYASPLALFDAEMAVLWSGSAVVAGLALAVGLYTGWRFWRRRRSVAVAGGHLATAVLAWLGFLAAWYFWQIGWGFWQGRVPLWRFQVFLAGGVALAGATGLGLVLHHTRPRPRATWWRLGGHVALAVLGVAAWLWGMAPFR